MKIRSFPFVTQDTYKDICRYVIDESGYYENPNSYLSNGFWVKTNYLHHFEEYLKNQEYVLFTGHCDLTVNESHRHILQHPNLIRWFAVNNVIEDVKLKPIIMGMGDGRYSHGNIAIVNKIQQLKNEKTQLLYGNFKIENNKTQRQACLDYSHIKLAGRGLGTNTFESYLFDVSCSYFQLCPEGNGPDTHRIYDSLLMNCTPIVTENLYVQAYRDAGFPILVLKDWAELEKITLSQELYYSIWKNFNVNELTVEPYLKRLGLL